MGDIIQFKRDTNKGKSNSEETFSEIEDRIFPVQKNKKKKEIRKHEMAKRNINVIRDYKLLSGPGKPPARS